MRRRLSRYCRGAWIFSTWALPVADRLRRRVVVVVSSGDTVVDSLRAAPRVRMVGRELWVWWLLGGCYSVAVVAFCRPSHPKLGHVRGSELDFALQRRRRC